MPANPVAENILGTIGRYILLLHIYFAHGPILVGTVLWTIQLLPQVWKSWRTKSTEGLSEYLG